MERSDLVANQLRSVQARWEVERAAILKRWADDQARWERDAALRETYHEEEVRGFVEEIGTLTARVSELERRLAAAAATATATATDPPPAPAGDKQ